MPNGKYHKKRVRKKEKVGKKSTDLDRTRPDSTRPTVEQVLGAMWIAHEKYYKPMDKMMKLVLSADGTGEIQIDEMTICRFKDIDGLFEWLRIWPSRK